MSLSFIIDLKVHITDKVSADTLSVCFNKIHPMKIILPLLLLFPVFTNCQIITSATRANFGVDADLRANYINSSANGAGDDWYVNSAGSGQGVIDTTGAASIVAGYISNVATRTRTFSRLMKQPFYSTLNNRLMIDAVFHRDYHGDDSTIFAAGSNKNGMSPLNWSCPVSQNIPDKNDILDVYTHVRRAGPNVTDSLWMFGGVSIENTTGNRYFDFELYQTDFYYDRSTRKFMNYGRDAGHTSWTFDSQGRIVTPGDIIFSAEYSSSSLSMIEARIWVNRAALEMSPVSFSWGGAFDGDGSGATYGYASIIPKAAGNFYTGLQSAAGVWAGPFNLILGNNTITSTYAAKQFMEFSVNMSKLGLDPAAYSSNPCGSPFRRVLIKTRASTSFSAELKDFVAPFRMFDYPGVDAYADLIYFCGTMPTVPIGIFNVNPASLYTWTTINGNIVSSTSGSTIQVNSPGTYYVQQKLHSSCPLYSRDSIKILFDPVCIVLKIQITDFKAVKRKEGTSLNWQISNNELAKTIQLQVSTDGRQFYPVSHMNAISRSGTESYSFLHKSGTYFSPINYYRLEVRDVNNVTFFSNTVFAKQPESAIKLYPNPSKGQVWLNVTGDEAVNYVVTDGTGRILISEKNITATKQTIPISGMTKFPPGVYFIQVHSRSNKVTHKLLIE
jgi:hypothetical protein